MKKNIIKNCVIPLLFSFLTILMVFVSGSTAHAAAQKVDSFDFGPKNSLKFNGNKSLTSTSQLSSTNSAVKKGVITKVGPNTDSAILGNHYLAWNKGDLKSGDHLKINYKNMGTFKGKAIDLTLDLSGFTTGDNKYDAFHEIIIDGKSYKNFIWFYPSTSILDGFTYSGFGISSATFNFKYTDGSGDVTLDDTSYMTIGSLNGRNAVAVNGSKFLHQEFTGYEKMGSNPYYLTKNTALAEYTNPITKSGNVVGGIATTDANFVDAVGDPGYTRGAVTYKLTGKNPKFTLGTTAFNQWTTMSTANNWNAYPEKPVKQVFNKPGTENAENNIDKKMIAKGSDVYYHITQKFGSLGSGGDQLTRYSSFTITDTFDNTKMDYKSGRLLLKNGSTFTVADAAGTIKLSGNKVTYTASSGFLNNNSTYGKTYVLELYMKAKTDASLIAKNTATTNFNNRYPQDTNTVENYFPKTPTKKVTQDGKDVNGRNRGQKGSSTAPLKTGSVVEYTVNYPFHKKGTDTNSDHYKSLKINDPLDSRLRYETGSAKIIDNSTKQDITDQGTMKYDEATKTLSWEASAAWLAATPLDGRSIDLVFKAKLPSTDQFDIKNKATVTVDGFQESTNEVINGVDYYLPNLVIPKTGNTHLIKLSLISVMGLIFSALVFVIGKQKNKVK
ncbi:isopeptide-forming domain-containing fimbrial protein [Enterococcus avium]|uniref:isopeptide-forming domain-containing fimbrial protein n=1 Tax=Enterococcus avium TaxID=33945 RepID=UPI0028902FC4|nr:isopeptide-forming domain-containing fimbrial protein [Enterococcus avium]MDT2482635.1 isopeptide-forming domain-containing fimbrial protein [Enterococcus avium]MDT2509331.1 isopeptide-forming domain-containing fimbrial protein [Enterococcus avium]